MIPNIGYAIFNFVIDSYVGFTSAVGGSFPSWFTSGFLEFFSNGNGMANIFLPVYPHPNMTGIVQYVGITTVMGFIGTMLIGLTFIGMFLIAIWLLLKIIPWNTN